MERNLIKEQEIFVKKAVKKHEAEQRLIRAALRGKASAKKEILEILKMNMPGDLSVTLRRKQATFSYELIVDIADELSQTTKSGVLLRRLELRSAIVLQFIKIVQRESEQSRIKLKQRWDEFQQQYRAFLRYKKRAAIIVHDQYQYWCDYYVVVNTGNGNKFLREELFNSLQNVVTNLDTATSILQRRLSSDKRDFIYPKNKLSLSSRVSIEWLVELGGSQNKTPSRERVLRQIAKLLIILGVPRRYRGLEMMLNVKDIRDFPIEYEERLFNVKQALQKSLTRFPDEFV